jgi:hypothetical protein
VQRVLVVSSDGYQQVAPLLLWRWRTHVAREAARNDPAWEGKSRKPLRKEGLEGQQGSGWCVYTMLLLW